MAHKGKPQIVEVEWLDASSLSDQMDLKQGVTRMQLDRRFSLGYLVMKDKDRIVIAATFDPASEERDFDQGDAWLVIPRGWVVKIIELQAPAGA